MYVLGINSAYHETSSCILSDDSILACVEEERFTGIRHARPPSPYGSWLLPFNAINYCLETANCRMSEIDHIAYSFQPNSRLLGSISRIACSLIRCSSVALEHELAYWYFNRRIFRFLRENAPSDHRIRRNFLTIGEHSFKTHFVAHHLCHAASAFYPSPYDTAAILSLDGIGESCSSMMALGQDTKIQVLKEIDYPHSLGFFYEEITKFLGFRRGHDEYKVMALAALGTPKYYDKLRQLVPLKPNGRYEVRISFYPELLFGQQELLNALGPPRLWDATLTERHADIAASAQKVLEETILHMLQWLKKQTQADNLCLAGGVALNCVMNERIRQEAGFDHVWVQPAANDAGTSLGAALWIWHQMLKHPRGITMDHAYYGPEFTDKEIEQTLTTSKIPFRHCSDIASACAELIAKGQIIGWFQGRMEWGPRALGNRSILGDPRNLEMKTKINQLKSREQFRPLAPSIVTEAIAQYFESSEPSPFMAFARKVRSERIQEIPAVVHADGTARVQTVSQDFNPLFHRLISRFGDLTGTPLVINTSLNYEGKPIVANIKQAIDCFFNTGLDSIALGPFLISKHEDAQ